MKSICWFVATVLAVATTGCSMVYEDTDDSCVASEEQVYLQFRIVNNTISTREAESRIDYTYEEATGAENYIGIEDKDFRLYVFDADRAADQMQNAQLISAYTPTLYPVGSNYAAYDIKIAIDKRKLKLTNDVVKLQFVCFANWFGTGNLSTTDYPIVEEGTTTRSQLLDQNGTNFYLPTPVSGETVTWAPNLEANVNGGRRIPMYGFRTYEFNKELLEKTTYNNPYNINVTIGAGSEDDGCLYMMRAMARFDVIDNITKAEDSEYPKVTSVSLVKWNSNGFCINTNLEGSDSKSYVSKASIPTISELVKVATPLAFQKGVTANIPAEYTGLDCYSAYLPELRFSDNAAKLLITIQYDNPEEGSPTIITHERYLYDLTDLNSNSFGQLRRNYVYRVVVTTSTSTIKLNATVMPWVIRKNNIEF